MTNKVLLSILILSTSSLALGETTVATTPQHSTAPSKTINQNANSGKSMQLIGAATNAGTAGFLMKICLKPELSSKWACPPAGLAALQAASMLNGAASAAKTAAATAYLNPGFGSLCSNGAACTDSNGDGVADTPIDTSSTYGSNPSDGKLFNEITNQTKGVLSALAKKGYTVNANGTVTTPDGKTVSGSDFSSPSSMSAMGMSDSQVTEAMNAFGAGAKAGDRARAVAVDTEGGGGGSAMAGAGGRKGGANDGGAGIDFAKLFGQQGRGVASVKGVQGLSKKLGNDNIGVAADNIFEITTRQYHKQENGKTFFSPAPGASATGAIGLRAVNLY